MGKARRSNLWGGITTVLIVCFCGMTAQGKYGGGTGTAEDPYQIWSAYDMQAIGADYYDWDRHFILMVDIDLGEFDGKDGREQFNVIGRRTADYRLHPFEGVFDGNGHTIVNFTYNSGNMDEIGLFGIVFRGEIRNLGLIDPNVNVGIGDYVGSLVGWAISGAITACYSDGGSVTGRARIGGLVGQSAYSTITDCYSMGTVEGTGSSVGGLVGLSGDGPIINCYAAGKVTGRNSVGGLVGFGSLVVNSYWDVDSGSPNNGIGTPKPRNEMMMADTFLNWGSCGAVWTINEGIDYPRLFWEGKPGEPIVGTPFPLLGDGSYSNPYLIYTPEELNAIGQIHCVWDKHFKMMADIDLGNYTGTQFNILPRALFIEHFHVAA